MIGFSINYVLLSLFFIMKNCVECDSDSNKILGESTIVNSGLLDHFCKYTDDLSEKIQEYLSKCSKKWLENINVLQITRNSDISKCDDKWHVINKNLIVPFVYIQRGHRTYLENNSSECINIVKDECPQCDMSLYNIWGLFMSDNNICYGHYIYYDLSDDLQNFVGMKKDKLYSFTNEKIKVSLEENEMFLANSYLEIQRDLNKIVKVGLLSNNLFFPQMVRTSFYHFIIFEYKKYMYGLSKK